MPGIAHLGIGLAAKRLAPAAPLGALLAASEATDILWGVLAMAGVENTEHSPWSHSLVTSVALSAVAGLLAARAYRDARLGAVVGLTALSHWALDFVVWKDNLPLLFEGSPKVGLGLYGPDGPEGLKLTPPVVVMELGLPLLGLLVYLHTRGVFGQQPALRKGVL